MEEFNGYLPPQIDNSTTRAKIAIHLFLSFSFLFSVKKKDIFSVSIIIPKKTKDCTGSKTDLAIFKKYPRLTNNVTAK
jgi:hypothetical protein